MSKVYVLGGGLSGLLISFYLQRRGAKVELFDAGDFPGGLLKTYVTEFGLVETAANGFMWDDSVAELFSELNLSAYPIKKKYPKRFIWRQGAVRSFPLTVVEALKLLPWIFRFKTNPKLCMPVADESLEEWGDRHLGRTITKDVLQTAFQGVYGATADQLSAKLVLKNVFTKNKPSGSYRGTRAPIGGMGALINALVLHPLKDGAIIHTQHQVTPPDLNRLHQECSLVIATSAPAAAKFLENLQPERSQQLFSVQTRGLISVTVFFSNHSKNVRGFGCLFPKLSGFHSLGVLFNSDIFPERNEPARSETYIFESQQMPQSSEQWLTRVLEDRKKAFGLSQQPLNSTITEWPYALPLYSPDHARMLEKLSVEEDGIYLMGNYLGEIGLSSLVSRAKDLATKII